MGFQGYDGFTLFDMGGLSSLNNTNASSPEFKCLLWGNTHTQETKAVIFSGVGSIHVTCV